MTYDTRPETCCGHKACTEEVRDMREILEEVRACLRSGTDIRFAGKSHNISVARINKVLGEEQA